MTIAGHGRPLTRRSLLTASLGALPAALLSGPAVLGATGDECAYLEADLESLRETIRALSRNTASGGGINLKMMPDPVTGEPTVPLEEVFSFDRRHALCRVDTNPQAFRMPTHELGDVTVEAHSFFMAMEASAIEEYIVSTNEDGSRSCRMRGMVSCATEIAQADVVLGSRTALEPAAYRIDAVDRGVGGGVAGDSFAFTVLFDPMTSPVNHSIFGPRFTFTGTIMSGEVTIIDPATLG